MAFTNHYRVLWHWEVGGKHVNMPQVDHVQCADNSYNTIKGVIVTNQGKTHGSATFVVDTVINEGPSGSIEQ